MKNLSAIIVDDEEDAIVSLQLLLKNYCPEVTILDTCTDILSAYKKTQELKPDILFLDIDLGNKTSFELLNLFDSIFFKIIFVTAHNDFAITAIKYSALDYILKPIDSLELIKAVNKAKENIKLNENYDLLKDFIHKKKVSGRIALSTGYNTQIVTINTISHCEADKSFTKVYLIDGTKLFISKSISDIEELLSAANFYRIHKSFIVNIDHIIAYTLRDGGAVTMKDNQEIPVSFRKKQEFFEYLNTLLKK